MSGHIITGKLGSGKTLCSVGRAEAYLKQGCIVATNIDLRANRLDLTREQQRLVVRVPDQPTIDDLNAIGQAYDIAAGYDETKTGLLMLDELATWFNARAWSDAGRKELNNWLVHARKLGWDVFLIIQNIEMLDKQARQALCDYLVVCKRTDRFKILGFGLPKGHLASVYQGHSENPKLRDGRWMYRGKRLYDAYDTAQVFTTDYPHKVHSVIPDGYFDVAAVPETVAASSRRYGVTHVAAGVAVAGLAYLYFSGGDGQAVAVSAPPEKPRSLLEEIGPLSYSGVLFQDGQALHLFSGSLVGQIDSYYFDKLGATVAGLSSCSASVTWPDGSVDLVHCDSVDVPVRNTPSVVASFVPDFMSGN